MQLSDDFLKTLSSSLDQITESIQPIFNDLKSLSKQLVTITHITQLKEIAENFCPAVKNIKLTLHKFKHFRRQLTKFLKNEEQNFQVSQTSLKIKKVKEKKHILNQLNKYKSSAKAIEPPSKLSIQDDAFIINNNLDDNLISNANFTSEMKAQLNENEGLNDVKDPISLLTHISCYVCKKKSRTLHFFYDQMCYDCGLFNYHKRLQTCDLSGKYALLTGARVKIGYQIALILMRNGCNLIATTRFPKDALNRFSQEKDFNVWKERLMIYGLDLRNLSSIKNFCEELTNTLPQLDIVINNAAQTNRHHPLFYKNLAAIENSEINDNFKNIIQEKFPCAYPEIKLFAIENSPSDFKMKQFDQLTYEKTENNDQTISNPFDPVFTKYFPDNCFDINNQQIELTTKNSWVKTFSEVSLPEFAEAQVINSWAPYLLCFYLRPILALNPSDNKHIINVSSMEGRFNKFKNIFHPHTNMAKASLDMLTRTCAKDFKENNIFMNSVDTGWVSEMLPMEQIRKRTVPLDELDGAMRVLDPVFSGLSGKERAYGRFFKDYKSIPLVEMDVMRE